MKKIIPILLIFAFNIYVYSEPIDITNFNEKDFIVSNGDVLFSLRSDLGKLINALDQEPMLIEERMETPYKRYKWDGLIVETLQDSITSISFWSPIYSIVNGINASMSEDTIQEVYGQPHIWNPIESYYFFEDASNTFYLLIITFNPQGDKSITLTKVYKNYATQQYYNQIGGY